MEMIFASIIAGIFAIGTALIAYWGYDQILRNKQRYHAWQILFEKKVLIFDRINSLIYEIADALTCLWEITQIEDKNPTKDDWHNLIGWNNHIKKRFGFEIDLIPPNIIENSVKWELTNKINVDEFKSAKSFLKLFVSSKIPKIFFLINEQKGKITLFVNNPVILDEISNIIIWLNDLDQSNKISNFNRIEYHNFADEFQERMSNSIKLMRYELHLNIEKITPDLTIKKTSKEEARDFISPRTVSSSPPVRP